MLRIVNVTVLRRYFIIRHCYIGVSSLTVLRLGIDDYPLLSLTIVTIIRTCNYDHVIVIVINARWRARRIGIVLRWMMIGRDGEADELCYVMYMFYSLLLAIHYGCNSRRSEYDAVPDKMKIKDDVTELWSLFIRHQHGGLPPIFISFSGIIEIRLLDMPYCA